MAPMEQGVEDHSSCRIHPVLLNCASGSKGKRVQRLNRRQREKIRVAKRKQLEYEEEERAVKKRLILTKKYRRALRQKQRTRTRSMSRHKKQDGQKSGEVIEDPFEKVTDSHYDSEGRYISDSGEECEPIEVIYRMMDLPSVYDKFYPDHVQHHGPDLSDFSTMAEFPFRSYGDCRPKTSPLVFIVSADGYCRRYGVWKRDREDLEEEKKAFWGRNYLWVEIIKERERKRQEYIDSICRL